MNTVIEYRSLVHPDLPIVTVIAYLVPYPACLVFALWYLLQALQMLTHCYCQPASQHPNHYYRFHSAAYLAPHAANISIYSSVA